MALRNCEESEAGRQLCPNRLPSRIVRGANSILQLNGSWYGACLLPKAHWMGRSVDWWLPTPSEGAKELDRRTRPVKIHSWKKCPKSSKMLLQIELVISGFDSNDTLAVWGQHHLILLLNIGPVKIITWEEQSYPSWKRKTALFYYSQSKWWLSLRSRMKRFPLFRVRFRSIAPRFLEFRLPLLNF